MFCAKIVEARMEPGEGSERLAYEKGGDARRLT